MISIRRTLLLVLLAMPLAAVSAPAGEPAEEKTLAVSFGLDIGDIDSEYGGTFFQPFVTAGQYELGLNWEARLRGIFTEKEKGVSTSGADGRFLLGWTWQWTEAISVGAVGGATAGIWRTESDEDAGGGANDFHMAAAQVGVRAKITGTEGLDLVGHLTAGPVLMYEDEPENDFEMARSYVFEGYLGVDWRLPQYAMTISVGVLYDRLDVDIEDVDDDFVMERVAVHLGLTVKF